MFHFEEKGRREDTLVCCHGEGWSLAVVASSSLPDKVVETSETIAAEALPVLVSLLLVRLPRSAIRVAGWRCCWFPAVVPVAVRGPVVVSPAVTRPRLPVPWSLRLSVPGRRILVIRWLLVVGRSETRIRGSDFSLPRGSLHKVVKSCHPIAAKGLPVLVGAPLQTCHSVKESWLLILNLKNTSSVL